MMIEHGIKKEEYREDKSYWKKRLWNEDGTPKHYDIVTFVYGYTKRKMSYKCNGIEFKTGNPKWGAEPDTFYNVIKIGERIKLGQAVGLRADALGSGAD